MKRQTPLQDGIATSKRLIKKKVFFVKKIISMVEDVFVISGEDSELNLEGDFLVSEVRIAEQKEDPKNTRLCCRTENETSTICVLMPKILERVTTRILLRPEKTWKLYTVDGAVEIKGVYVHSAESGQDILFIDQAYQKTLGPDEKFILKESYNIEFFSAALENACSERTSVVFEICGKDATICTLSHGCCSNASFRYRYRCNSELVIYIIGPGCISLLGSRCE